MTSRNVFSWSVASVLAIAACAAAWARQTQPATPPPRPVLIQPSVAQQRFRQTVQQNQVRDQLRKNQVEHQLRQESIERTRRPASSSSSANDPQVNKAQQAQDQLYQAQQRDRVLRYSDALLPQPVPQATQVDDKGH